MTIEMLNCKLLYNLLIAVFDSIIFYALQSHYLVVFIHNDMIIISAENLRFIYYQFTLKSIIILFYSKT